MSTTFKINCVICNKKLYFKIKKDSKTDLIKVNCPICSNIMYFEILEDGSLKRVF